MGPGISKARNQKFQQPQKKRNKREREDLQTG
jgi:hypothetical protein